MGEDHGITNHAAQQEDPPDILLTNYKMLDYLLLRPQDQNLWRFNVPGVLQYLVLDELHTYDGAQGADVACLIRRLKERLDIPQGRALCGGHQRHARRSRECNQGRRDDANVRTTGGFNCIATLARRERGRNRRQGDGHRSPGPFRQHAVRGEHPHRGGDR